LEWWKWLKRFPLPPLQFFLLELSGLTKPIREKFGVKKLDNIMSIYELVVWKQRESLKRALPLGVAHGTEGEEGEKLPKGL